MLRKLFQLGRPLASTLLPQTKKLPIFPYAYPRSFTSRGKLALTEHQQQIRLMQYLSTKMEEPAKIQQVNIKEWQEQGFLSQMKDYTKGLELYEAVDVPQLEGKNTPTGSWIRFKFPLSTDPSIRDNFQKFYSKGLRVGRILEVMDYLAGTVAYRYSKENPKARNATMVTASVYDVALFENQLQGTKDLLLTGYVCHVGKSSLEIRVDISHSEDPKDQAGSAYFMFVARDAKDYTKAFALPELSFEGEKDEKKCILRDEYGKRNKDRRKTFSEKSVYKVPPSSEEGIQLHQIFKYAQDPKIFADHVPISKTQQEKLVLMHVQDKNRHGRVFGGLVMREATELAWMTALLHGDGSYPQYIHIDDIGFVRPIPIGSITRFRSCVSYIEDNLIHVEVIADNLKAKAPEERVFEVNVTFAVNVPPQKVLPCTYSEGMLYLEGKRRLSNFFLL